MSKNDPEERLRWPGRWNSEALEGLLRGNTHSHTSLSPNTYVWRGLKEEESEETKKKNRVREVEEPLGNTATKPTEESLSREHSANCAKCLQKVPVRYKRSLDCAIQRKRLMYLGGFRGKQGQKPDGRAWREGGVRRQGTEAELRRRERRKNWGSGGQGI